MIALPVILVSAAYLVFATAKILSPFFRNSYQVLATSAKETLQQTLQTLHAGRVKIRFSIPPEEYNSTKRELEKELRGHRDVVVLKFDEVFVVAEDVA